MLMIAVVLVALSTPVLSAQTPKDLEDGLTVSDVESKKPNRSPPTPTGPPKRAEKTPEEEAAEAERNRKRREKSASGKKKATDWSKVQERDLEKDWEEGDEPEEIEAEYEHSQKVIEKRKEMLEKENKRKAKLEAQKAAKAAKAAKAKAKAAKAAKAAKGKGKGEAEAEAEEDGKAKGKGKGKGKGKSKKVGDDKVIGDDPDDEEEQQLAAELRAHAKREQRDGKSQTVEQLMAKQNLGMPGGVGGSFKGGGPSSFLDQSTGSAMYFVDLHPVQPHGKNKGQPWDKLSVDDLAGYWSSMLKSAHLSANVYNLGALNKDGQMLLSLDKGWQSSDILKFVLKQPAVKQLNKDNRQYTKDMFFDAEGEEL
jgi:hypothetical protein